MLKLLKGFGGAIKRVAPHLIPDNAAQEATNCDLGNGNLRPLNDVLQSAVLGKAGTKKSLHLFADAFWLHWLDDVDVAKGPIAGDTTERTYFTGDGVPKFTYAGPATSGGDGLYPSVSYLLGVPNPVSTPTVLISGGTASEDPADERDRVYIYTWVNALGEESGPSSPSGIVTVSGDQTVGISNMEVTPTGTYVGFATKRIYRTDSLGAYRYVASVLAAATTYDDAIEDVALGEEIITADWLVPKDDLSGLIALPNGSLAGFYGKTVCICVPNQPHAWPVAGEYTVHDDIIAIGAFGTSILVVTDSYPVMMSGFSYDAYSVERVETSQACILKRGVVDVGYSVAYPSPDGLVLIGLQQAANITEKTLEKEHWAALTSDLVFGVGSVEKYYGFKATGGFIVNLRTGELIEHDVTATAGYYDGPTGYLYLVQGDNVVIWDEGEAPLEFTWKSKKFIDVKPSNYGFAQVYALAWPVTVKFTADGTVVATKVVENIRPFRLPSGFLATQWELEITSSSEVQMVAMANSMQELMAV